MEQYEKIEKSITKKFRKEIWNRFIQGLTEYNMISEGDKIAVCISGGKDSALLAKCMQLIQRHKKMNFELVYLVMDPGYSKENRKKIENNAKILNIPIVFFESPIFDKVVNIDNSPCYLCARMRRGYLYEEAKKQGCNKIALGHHFNDVIETILMGIFYGSQVQTMMPKVRSTSHPGMELIRPLYFVREDDIISWRDSNFLSFLQCACRFTEEFTKSKNINGESKRQEMKELIKKLKKGYPNIDINIFRSVENVNLDTIISYKKGKEYHSFLDNYDL